MAQQHRDLRYPTVNFHSRYYTADLVGDASSRRSYYNYGAVSYDSLERALDEGRTIIGPKYSVAPTGYYLAGTSGSDSWGKGNRAPTGNVYKRLPTPETKIEYRADPAQAERLKKLEDELKIANARPTITPEMVEYREKADATLRAAEERLAQFAINKSAFETQQQEAAAAAAQREAAFQAAMKQREDIFAQTSAAKTADMAKRASAFEQQMEQQRAELVSQESERQALFAKSMEEQRAALSGQTAELGRQRTAFETEMLGARQEFAGQREAFEKSAAEREEAFQKMTIQQQEAFRKEQKEAEAAANRAAAVRSANQRRSELAQTIQIQPAEGATRRFAGTQGFRRRATQFGTASPYKGLGTIQSGMVNV